MYVYAQASAASVASFRACASGTGGSLGRLCVCLQKDETREGSRSRSLYVKDIEREVL